MKTMVSTAGSGVPSGLDGADALAPGAKAGPWLIERELGRGGMGAVYAVVHENIGKRAALKIVHKRLLANGFNTDRMLLEAKVVNQVGHPNIVDIFETGMLGDGRPYIVMERLDGQSLSARADGAKLLPDVVIAILLQICDALIAAHAAGVVHRDLKLDNVFLVDNVEDPATPKVKLLDWGIAKLVNRDVAHSVKHTVEGQLVGTPQYLSPEQARGHAVSPQSDIYSLGVMAYELFLEQLPFEAETAAEVMAMHLRAVPPPPHELWPDVPPVLEALLLAMLAKQPEHRPTALEVAHQLEAVRVELERRRQVHALPVPAALAAPGRTTRNSARGLRTPSVGLANTEHAERSEHTWRPDGRRWQYTVGVAALATSALLIWISRDGDRAAIAATGGGAAVQHIAAADALRAGEPIGQPLERPHDGSIAGSAAGSITRSMTGSITGSMPGPTIGALRPSSSPAMVLSAAREAHAHKIEGRSHAAATAVLETAAHEAPQADVMPPAARPQAMGAAVIAAADPIALREPPVVRITPAALHTDAQASSPRAMMPRVPARVAQRVSAVPRRGANIDPDGTLDAY